MLQNIREKSSGWIAYVILGLIIITMAFFGIESYFAPKVETYSARITGPGVAFSHCTQWAMIRADWRISAMRTR